MSHAPAPRSGPAHGPSAVDTAWRIHTAVAEWTGRVDVKASVVLTMEVAVFAGLVTLSADRQGAVHGARPGLLWAGALFLVGAVVSAVLVVTPRMRIRQVAGEAADNFVYFGHLRLWDPARLATALDGDVLEVLTRDIVVNSGIAWRKHRLLQLSIVLATVGVLLLLLGLAARPA